MPRKRHGSTGRRAMIGEAAGVARRRRAVSTGAAAGRERKTGPDGKPAPGPSQTPNTTLPSLGGFSATFPVALSDSGSARGTTKSAVSGGTVIVTDEAGQQALTGKDGPQTVAGLNRDTANANGSIKPIFDKTQVDANLAIGEKLLQQFGTFLNTKAREADAAKAAVEKAKREGADEATVRELQARADEAGRWAPGGTYRQIMGALIGGISGNLGASGSQLIESAAINYLQGLTAQQVKQIADGFMVDGKTTAQSEALRGALQALTACAGAAAQRQDCSTAAMAAAGSVALNNLLGQLPPDATAQEKAARENLITTFIAGVATIAGADAATATNAAAIEMENNALRKQEVQLIAINCKGNRNCEIGFLKEFNDRSKRMLADCKTSGNCDRFVAQYQDGIRTLLANSKKNGGVLDDDLVAAQIAQNMADIGVALQNQAYFDKTTLPKFKAAINLLLDITPVIGDWKGLAEAETTFDYALAAVGMLGPVGDASKALIKEAKVLMEAGETAKAAEKIQEAKAATNAIPNSIRADGLPVEKNAGFDTANLQSKLEGYLLDATHPQNQNKAVWFDEALGFNESNWQQLASQLTFNESKAVATEMTQYGQKFEQTIPIVGANGKTIDVVFVFMKDATGTVRLVTGIPTKK